MAARTLSDARRALASLQYARAFALASEALTRGGAEPDQVEALYRVQGEAAAVLGDEAAAERAFAAMLELSPGAQLPADSSPKLLQPLARARVRLNGAHLTLEARSAMLVEGWVHTELTVSGDVLGQVKDVELLPLWDGAAPLRASSWALSWRCPSAPCPHLVRARDAAGNVLATLGTPAAPLSVRPLPAPPPPPPEPLWARPLPYALGGAALALAGGVFAWQLHDAEAQLRTIEGARASHTLAEAQAADQRRHTDQLAMIVSFAGAGVLGTVAVVVW